MKKTPALTYNGRRLDGHPSPFQKPRDLEAVVNNLVEALKGCAAQIEQLQRESETHVKRMAAMQAEIDHLRAKIGP